MGSLLDLVGALLPFAAGVAVLIALIPEREEAVLSAGIRLLLGLALVILGLTKWRTNPEGLEKQLPGWMLLDQT